MKESSKIYIAYELQHVDEACLMAAQGATVVCLDFWTERALKKQNVPCVSLHDFVGPEDTEEGWWELAQEVAREWYRLPAMRFFEHKGIRIAENMEPVFEVYLSRLFYYARAYTTLKKVSPGATLHIPAPMVDSAAASGGLLIFEQLAVVDAAQMAGLQSIVVGKSTVPSRERLFPSTLWKSFLVWMYDVAIGLLPRRRLKVYASEYWSHIGPTITQMDDAELVLMEVRELKHISWRQILKHRIRVRHPADAVTGSMKRSATAEAKEFMKQWATAKGAVASYLSTARKELNWQPVLDACEYLITYSPRVIADIDALERIMREEKPGVILQLASIGGRRHHFFLMARIAARLHIPSVELQHAGAYTDARSPYSRIETDLLAAYGTYSRKLYAGNGYAPDRIIPVGSPRFDRCLTERPQAFEKGKQLFKQLGLDSARQVLFVAVSYAGPNFPGLDSYQLAECFRAVRLAQDRLPGVQVLFKFRSYYAVGAAGEYLRELFPAGMAIAGNEDVFALLRASDAAVCGNSTVLYQAMLAEKPLLLYPWKKFDTYHGKAYTPAAPIMYDAKEFIDSISRIFADAQYRTELLGRQANFLKGYSFDGKSSIRLAALLESFAGGTRASTMVFNERE